MSLNTITSTAAPARWLPALETQTVPASAEYALATGTAAVRRLHVLHDIYSPAGRRVLMQAGLRAGMHVADFGCGVGVVSRMLAKMVGPSGTVTGIDINAAQLEQAHKLCRRERLTNTSFLKANASATGLPSNLFDLAYCRFLLIHLPDPEACLQEMLRVLKPGGILVVEDGDLTTAGSVPATALDTFSDLWGRLGPIRGLDYTLGKRLYHMVKDAGFPEPDLEIHQPAMLRGENRFFLKWSIEEAGAAFVGEGVTSADALERTLCGMQEAIDDPNVVILAPRMSLVWARKPLS